MMRETTTVLLLICSLVFWSQPTRAGVTFLSPSHKPPSHGKPPRVARQAMEWALPLREGEVKIAAPFEVGVPMQEEDFEEDGQVLQNILQYFLGDTDTTE